VLISRFELRCTFSNLKEVTTEGKFPFAHT